MRMLNDSRTSTSMDVSIVTYAINSLEMDGMCDTYDHALISYDSFLLSVPSKHFSKKCVLVIVLNK